MALMKNSSTYRSIVTLGWCHMIKAVLWKARLHCVLHSIYFVLILTVWVQQASTHHISILHNFLITGSDDTYIIPSWKCIKCLIYKNALVSAGWCDRFGWNSLLYIISGPAITSATVESQFVIFSDISRHNKASPVTFTVALWDNSVHCCHTKTDWFWVCRIFEYTQLWHL